MIFPSAAGAGHADQSSHQTDRGASTDIWTATEHRASDRSLPLILHGYWFPSLWPSFNEVSTADGSELSLRSTATTCQISWSVSNLPQAGIPVLRIPCLTIQKSSPSLYPDGCTVNCGAGG